MVRKLARALASLKINKQTPHGEPGATNQNEFSSQKGLYYSQQYTLEPNTQTIPQLEKPDVEVLGWRGYMWSEVVRPVGHTAKFFKMTLKVAYGREINIKLSGNSSGGHSCRNHANFMLPQL
jgi:hypothetical protein